MNALAQNISPSAISKWLCVGLVSALLYLPGALSAAQSTAGEPEITEEVEAYLKRLRPRHAYGETVRTLFRLVDQLHYLDKDLDRAFSLTTYDRHIENLDPQHNLFLQGDLDQLKQLKPGIYKALHGRNLRGPYTMYQLRQKRAAQALLYQIKAFEANQFNFDKMEYLEADREDLAAFTDWNEWKGYWRRVAKNQLLLSLLSDTDTPREEAIARLQRRLKNRLKTLLRNDAEDALASFVNSALSQYDPHTSYLPPQEYQDWLMTLQTQLEGIGAMLSSKNDYTEVIRLIEGGPAQTSGRLRVGDRIIGIVPEPGNELVDVVGMSLSEVVRMIRGKKGTRVVLEILPQESSPGAPTEMLTLVRDIIPIENQRASYEITRVDAYDRDWRIGIIRLPSFYSNSPKDPNSQRASEDIRSLIKKLKTEGVDGLILDMRDNGGGYLNEAISVASLFLPPGAFVQIRNQGNRIIPDGQRRSKPEWTEPMAVLVSRLSASASEIVAAAIQDYKRGLVLGTTTFGKGTVQSTYSLGNEKGELKLTRSKFYRVNGGATQGKGVVPDLMLPAIWDPENIGENAYDNALIFDTIQAMKLHHRPGPQADLALLQTLHQQRKNTEYGLQYLAQRRLLLDQLTEDSRIPLQLEARKQHQKNIEQRQLELENKARQAEQQATFATWDNYRDWEDKNRSDPDYQPRWEEILQTEAAQILVDHIQHAWLTQTVNEPYDLRNKSSRQ